MTKYGTKPIDENAARNWLTRQRRRQMGLASKYSKNDPKREGHERAIRVIEYLDRSLTRNE